MSKAITLAEIAAMRASLKDKWIQEKINKIFAESKQHIRNDKGYDLCPGLEFRFPLSRVQRRYVDDLYTELKQVFPDCAVVLYVSTWRLPFFCCWNQYSLNIEIKWD
jgi:hypothetical protein